MIFTISLLLLPVINAIYAPQRVACPGNNTEFIQQPSVPWSLRPDENVWLQRRSSNARYAWTRLNGDWCSNSNCYVSDLSESNVPRLGIAISGGGFRAAIHGAGILSMLANQSQPSNANETFRGLYDAALYLSGSSGSSWLIGGIYQEPTMEALPDLWEMIQGWELQRSVLLPENSFLRSVSSYRRFNNQIDEKEELGFETTLTDILGRLLRY
jgi:lysophospholipase